MGASEVRRQGYRTLHRLPHRLGEPQGLDALAERLGVPPHGVGELQVRLRVGVVQADRLLGECLRAQEQFLPVGFTRDIEPVYRQRLGRQGEAFRGSHRRGQLGRFGEASVGIRRTRCFRRLRVRGREPQGRGEHGPGGPANPEHRKTPSRRDRRIPPSGSCMPGAARRKPRAAPEDPQKRMRIPASIVRPR